MRLLFIENFNRWWTASSAGVSTLLNHAIYSVSGHQKFARKFGASRRRELELLSLGWNKLQLAVLEPTSEKAGGHWCEARKRPRSFVTDLDTQTSPSQPAHKLIFFPTFFFWAKRFKVSLFFSRFSRNNHAHTTPLHAAIVPHKYFAHCTNTRAKRTTVTYEHKRRWRSFVKL